MSPIISIIVPVYNVEKYIYRCLDSLVNQTMKDIEIICINDGSTDKSLEIIKEYALQDKRITVIDQVNMGVSVARNNGIKHVNGDFYMFVDSDDWIDLETCEVVYDYAIKNNADCLMFSYTKEFVGHNVVNHIFNKDYFVWNESEVKSMFYRRLFGPVGEELKYPQNVDIIVTPCMQLFRTDKFSHISFVDIRKVGTFEDGLYQMEVYKECKRFVYIDRPFYHYLKTNEGSITTHFKADLFERWQCLYDIIQSHIDEWFLPAIYNKALNNRIAIGVIGLGLNQTHSNDNTIQGSRHLKEILQNPRYSKAIKQLKISKMPILWKIFFLIVKSNFTLLLFVMLKLIEYLRVHKK